MDAQQTKIYTAIIIAALVIGCILVVFIISLISQQRKNSRLFREKIMAEITTLENERSRVAADLHDELGPLLFSVKFKLSGLEITGEDHDDLEKANLYIDDIIQRIRDISNNLMPGTLLRKGVLFAIEEYIGSVSKTESLKIDFIYDELPELGKEKAINIYRVVMEIIHNTMKHSKAKLLSLEIKNEAQRIIISGRDDGSGFDYESVKLNNSGLGLRNMLNRAEVMGGDMYIESKPGKGTQYTIEIPVP